MATNYVVDTHALVWFLEGNPRLGANAKAVLEDRGIHLIIPIIVLAEACWMIEHGKTSIPTVNDFLRSVDEDPRISIIPLDPAVLKKTLPLVMITEMHDRQIVATALVLAEQGETVVVLTKDNNIRDSQIIPTVW